MKRKFQVLLLLILLMISIINIVPKVSARLFQVKELSIHLVTKLTDCYGNIAGLTNFEVPKGCDNNDTPQYIGQNSGAIEWIVFNLSSRFVVDHIQAVWKNYPGSGHIDVWTGSSWVNYKNYTYSGVNSNQTITLDHNFLTTKLRLYMSGPFESVSYAGFAEIWVYGDNPPSDFSISLSKSTLGIHLNTEGSVIISISGKEGFTGRVNLTASSSDSHATVICAPIILIVNITPSECSISADATGHYTITFTGTNVTIGQTHSITLSLIVTIVDYTPIWFIILLLLFAFIVLFIVGFFERFAMVGAGLVSAIIAVLSWTWTDSIYVPAVFVLLMTLCIGLAMTKKK